MRSSDPITLAIVSTSFLTALAGCSSHPTPATPGGPAISVADIWKHGVMGRLGRPLGTMVKVSGVAVPNHTRMKFYEDDKLFLRITTVDGRPLAEPVEYPFRKAVDFIEATEPKVGEEFTYRGYESGIFDGVPDNYACPWQARGFGFIDQFLILPATDEPPHVE